MLHFTKYQNNYFHDQKIVWLISVIKHFIYPKRLTVNTSSYLMHLPSQQCACRFGCSSFSFLNTALFSGDIGDLLLVAETTDSFFLALLDNFGEVTTDVRCPWGDELLPVFTGELRVCFFLAGSRCEVECRGDRWGDRLAIFSVAFLLASSSEVIELMLSVDAKDDSLLIDDDKNGGGK